MARRTEVNFETFYNDATTGVYRAGQADGAIDSSDHRQLIDDILDCFEFNLTVDYATTQHMPDLSGSQTVDGFIPSVGQTVLVKDQTGGTGNRIYVVVSGAWQGFRFFGVGDFIKVKYGNVNGGRIYFPSGTTTCTRYFITNETENYNSDLNSIDRSGLFYADNSATNRPVSAVNGYVYSNVRDSSFAFQAYFEYDNDKWYTRVKDAGVWLSWVDRSGSGAIGGSTGSLDNALIRADGTGGSTIQAGALLYGTDDGRLYGTALHNNAGSMTGTTNQYIGSGTYTPTLTNQTNLSASTAYVCQWIRVGNVVTVSGRVDIDPTAVGGFVLEMTLPISTNLSASTQAAGTFASFQTYNEFGAIARNTSNTVQFNGTSTTDVNHELYFTFTYLVL